MSSANVNAHSRDIIMDIYISRCIKAGTSRQRSTNPRPNVNVLGLHQKLSQRGNVLFLSSGDSKSKLVALFIKFLKLPVSEEYRKYII